MATPIVVDKLAIPGATTTFDELQNLRLKRSLLILTIAMLWQTLLQNAKLVIRGHIALPGSPLVQIASTPLLETLGTSIWNVEHLLLREFTPLLPY